MTGYFSATIGKTVEILSDGAAYDSDGILLYTCQKVRQLGELPATIMTRGMVDDADDIEDEIDGIFSAAASFDAAIVDLEAELARKHLTGESAEPMEITICGFSERATARPLNGFVYTRRAVGAPYSTVTGLMDSRELPASFHQQITRSGTLADKGVFLMEELRKSPGKHISFETVEDWPCVGGHIDHTVITREGVTIERLHTWPDKIGEKLVLQPSKLPGQYEVYRRSASAMRSSAPAAAPPVAQPMNRHQRRADRVTRKAAA